MTFGIFLFCFVFLNGFNSVINHFHTYNDIIIRKDSWDDGRRRHGLAFSFQVTHLMQYSKKKQPFSWVIYLMRLSRADKWESATEEFDEIIKCKDKMLNCLPLPNQKIPHLYLLSPGRLNTDIT